MSWLGLIDDESLEYADNTIKLQEILTNINEGNVKQTVEQLIKSPFAQDSDGVCTIVENIINVISIRANVAHPLARLVFEILDHSIPGSALSNIGRLLFVGITHQINDELFLQKIPHFILLRRCIDIGIFKTDDVLTPLNELYNSKLYNQFALLFLITAPDLEIMNIDYYEAGYRLGCECVEDHLLDDRLSEHINRISEYKRLNWRLFRDLINEGGQKNDLSRILRYDNIELMKSVSTKPEFHPNAQYKYSIFEPIRFLSHEPTLIEMAAFYGAYNCFKYLYKLGAKLHYKDGLGRDVAPYVVAGGSTKILKYIEKYNVSFKRTLNIATEFRRYEIMDWIIAQRGKDIGDLNKELRNVFCAAAKFNNFRTFLFCLEKGNNITNRDRHGLNALLSSISHGNYYMTQFITWFDGVDPNTKNQEGMTGLSVASELGDGDIAELLADTDGVRVNTTDKTGKTPLHHAAENNHSAIIQILLSSRAKINAKDSEGKTPLHLAVANNSLQAVRILLEAKADLEEIDKSGRTPAQYATDPDIISLFEL